MTIAVLFDKEETNDASRVIDGRCSIGGRKGILPIQITVSGAACLISIDGEPSDLPLCGDIRTVQTGEGVPLPTPTPEESHHGAPNAK